MKTGRLKALNRQIEGMFTQPLAKPRKGDYRENTGVEYLQCDLCQEVRRENYRLKQQALEMEERREELLQARRETEALKELYQLKCRQADLLRDRLEEAERQVEAAESEKEALKRNGVLYFENLLSK